MNANKELHDRIQQLHEVLNELYRIDSNWRMWGSWPSDVTGSILHPPASDAEIATAEERLGVQFPPSYKEFLRLHSAWEHFYGDFTLIGTGPAGTEKAQAEIREYADRQTEKLKAKLGNDFNSDGIERWEAEQPRFIYLANHLVIGVDCSGALWVYDVSSRRPDGEMTLWQWNISYGAQEPKFENFTEFLDWAIIDATERLAYIRDAINNPGQSQDDDDD